MKIAFLGKFRDNQWGLEGIIQRNIKNRKEFICIDVNEYFPERYFLESPNSILVVLQGRGLDHSYLRRIKAKKILWNAEFWPYEGKEGNQEAAMRLDLVEPLESYDLILNGCPLSTKFLKEKRGLNIEWFPMIGIDPTYHRDLKLDKIIDIGFYGAPSPRRIKIWNDLIKLAKQNSYNPLNLVWKQAYGEGLIQFINQTKVMLNLHYADLLNTESRIYEVLGCGGFCLSEPISLQGRFLDGLHFEGEETERMAQRAINIRNYEESTIKRIAQNGYEYVHDEFNISEVLNQLIVAGELLLNGN
mgnify:CR=1 FL=1